MNALFYSEQTCYLKVDCKFVGEISKNTKLLKNFSKDCFLEFIPKNNDYFPIATLFKDKLNAKIFNLKEDFVIVPLFQKKLDLKYKVLLQEIINVYNNSLVLTVVQDGGYKFYLDGVITFTDALPFKVESFEYKVISNTLFLIFIGIKSAVFAFDLNSNKLLFKNMCDKVYFDGFLNIENTYKTAIPIMTNEKWDLNNFKLVDKALTPLKIKYDINSKLLSTAFFEWVSIGVSVKDLLSIELQPRERELYSFIGKPIAVFPYYKDADKTVILDNDNAHLYTLQFKDNLICNIIEE